LYINGYDTSEGSFISRVVGEVC